MSTISKDYEKEFNRFIVQLRKNTTQYEIKDQWKTGESPFIESFFYKKTAKDLCKFLNSLNDKIMDTLAENTKMKLILADIIRDLEKQAESKEPIIINKNYVEWIKEEAGLDFSEFGRKDGTAKEVKIDD